MEPDIRIWTADEVAARADALAEVLEDCVDGGASVGFVSPVHRDRTLAFWRRVAQGVAAGERVVVVAELDGRIVGTVQLALAMPENQPHRAEVAKMLVHRDARRRGIADRLLGALEAEALRRGRTLLVLDTVTGSDAERLYTRAGWHRVGVIPDYARMPDGAPCATTYFYKPLP